MKWTFCLVVAACGPGLEVTRARHVIVALDHQAIALGCEEPCHRILKPGERFLQCVGQEFGWPNDPPLLDVKKVVGSSARGMAVCKVGS